MPQPVPLLAYANPEGPPGTTPFDVERHVDGITLTRRETVSNATGCAAVLVVAGFLPLAIAVAMVLRQPKMDWSAVALTVVAGVAVIGVGTIVEALSPRPPVRLLSFRSGTLTVELPNDSRQVIHSAGSFACHAGRRRALFGWRRIAVLRVARATGATTDVAIGPREYECQWIARELNAAAAQYGGAPQADPNGAQHDRPACALR